MQADEPFTKLLCQGMVLNHIYSRKNDKGGKEYFWPHDVEHVHDDAGKIVGAKLKHAVDYAGEPLPAGTPITYEGVGTMSKSKNNGIDPQQLIDQYGADTARLYTMFTAPPEATLEWNDGAVEGSYRFLRRVWAFGAKHSDALRRATSSDLSQAAPSKAGKALRRELHLVLKQISYDYERMQYNTVVSGSMKMLNALEAHAFDGSDGDNAVLCEGVSILLRCLYPATPHLAHQAWAELGFAKVVGELLDAPWPQVDETALVQDEIELMLQINGKLRGAIRVSATAGKADIEAAALASEACQKAAGGAPAKKVIVVPGRLVNIVL
jgi:leucyl-tRNA synthetase